MAAEEVMAKQLLVKQSGERLRYTMDFTNRIDSGVTIEPNPDVSSTTVGEGVSDLVIEEVVISGKKVLFYISGGTHAKSYTLHVEVELSNTEILIGSGMLKIIDA